jgi:CheY-like chemotaxis protein
MPTDAPTILIADDETHIVHILQSKFRRAGYEVLVARNGQEALDLATLHRPDLAVTDLNMPGTDGLYFARGLAQNPQTAHIPVIMLTGRGHTLSDEQRATTHIRLVESKPFSARQLLARVQGLLGIARAA